MRPTILKNAVPTTDTFQFLGTTIIKDLKWSTHTDSVQKKTFQLLVTFLSALIQSVLGSSITVWFGSATRQRTFRSAGRIVGTNLPTVRILSVSRTRKYYIS